MFTEHARVQAAKRGGRFCAATRRTGVAVCRNRVGLCALIRRGTPLTQLGLWTPERFIGISGVHGPDGRCFSRLGRLRFPTAPAEQSKSWPKQPQMLDHDENNNA